VAFVQALRAGELFKPPGVAETLDWARALVLLGRAEIEAAVVEDTLGVLLKYQDDLARLRAGGAREVLSGLAVMSNA